MAFKRVPQTFNAKINEVTLGTGDKAVKIGGENTFTLYTFDAPSANKVAVGFELTNDGVDKTLPGLASFFDGCNSVAEMAKKAETMPGVDFIALSLVGADPNGDNKSVEECVALAKEVADAITLPLAIMGCKNGEKDGQLFDKIAEALQGKNVLFISTKEENYKVVSASAGIAYNQKIC
ncbi:MAG: acetyl-CoA synthase subunit delta, partial [Bacillota bacterium]|nr:acetyl-CoA synthase subunit delta [Bacillota bacterium]